MLDKKKKKIVLFMNYYSLPVPSIIGGGVEELMTMLLNENEVEKKIELHLVQKQFSKKECLLLDNFSFKNTEISVVKYSKIKTFFVKVFNFAFKLLKIKVSLTLPYYKNAYKLIKNINPDLIIFESEYEKSYMKKFVDEFGKEKLAFHIHYQMLNKNDISNYFSNLICVSDFISDDWKKYFDSINKKINLSTLKNCVDEDRFQKKISLEERNKIRGEFGFSKDDFVVFYCGRICADKGVKQLINAVLKLNNSVKLLIAGGISSARNETTPYLHEVKTLVENNPDKLKFTGYIKNCELFKIYNSVELQVAPSMWEEAAGLVVIEGQHAGLPQVITNSGGMVEFVCKNSSIIVKKEKNIESNLCEAILKFYNEKNELVKYKEISKNHALHFTKNNYYENFVKIVEEICKNE